jgi:hypothetical protein
MGDLPKLRNRKSGRPSSYNKKYATLAYKLARMGANEREIASVIGIEQRTLIRWKKEFEEFCHAICNGKNDYNLSTKKALFKRVSGYRYTEITKQKTMVEQVNDEGETVMVPATIIKTVSKHVPPDVNACLSVLRRNRTKDWD